MDRATKALKRSSIRLKPHANLNMLLSDLDDIRSTEKASIRAHQVFSEDLIKWVHQDSSEGIKHLFSLMGELNNFWSGIHYEFLDNLKTFKHQFDVILENKISVDKARDHLLNCEQIQMKLKKDIKRIKKKQTTPEEIASYEEGLRECERAVVNAKVEVSQKITENEIVKFIRLKTGLMKLTESLITLSQKSNIILLAQQDIVSEIPDVLDNGNIQDIKVTECNKARRAVLEAKENLQSYTLALSLPKGKIVPLEYEAPPPYSPFNSDVSLSGINVPSCSSQHTEHQLQNAANIDLCEEPTVNIGQSSSATGTNVTHEMHALRRLFSRGLHIFEESSIDDRCPPRRCNVKATDLPHPSPTESSSPACYYEHADSVTTAATATATATATTTVQYVCCKCSSTVVANHKCVGHTKAENSSDVGGSQNSSK